MPLPTSSDLHVNSVLQPISISYGNERATSAADAIAPLLKVSKQSDLFAKWSRADWTRIQMEVTANQAPMPIMSYGVATESYFCNVYSGKTFTSARDRAQAKNEFELDEANIDFLNQQAFIRREKLVADALFVTSKWATDSTPSTKWSAGSSDPFGDIRTGARTIHAAIGRWPTDLVCGADVWDTLADHADTIGRISGGATASDPVHVLPEMIAGILGLKRVTIADASYNTASAGATYSGSQIYATNDALLCYRPDAPSKFTPSCAYSFSWDEFDETDALSAAITSWPEDDPKGDWTGAQMAIDPKVTATEAGYFFSAATS